MHSRRVVSFMLAALIIAVSLIIGSGSIPQARAAVTIYVDDNSTCVASCGGSWATAYPDLQQALAAAVSGDQIWVAAGVYYPDVNGATNSNSSAVAFAMKSGVSLYGGFAGTETMINQRNFAANVSILSGDITQNDTDPDGDKITEDRSHIVGTNSTVVVSANSVTGVTIDGFTITAGMPSFNGTVNISGGTVTLNNIVSVGSGGDANAQLWVVSTNLTVTNAVFMNGPRGMWLDGTTSASLTNVAFLGNLTAYAASAIYWPASGSKVLQNAIFVGNVGSGVVVSASNLTGRNLTFASNPAAAFSGATGTVANSILWGNAAAGPMTYSYSDVQGGAAGTGNINTDPLFVTAPNSGDGNWATLSNNNYGDLRLQSTSPAIDTGNNASVVVGTDIAGNVRVLDGPDVDTTATVDMGAYEFFVPPTAPTITSANSATFYEAVSSTFTVTATGMPSAMTYTLTGALPAGVSFNPATGVLSGTPAVGTEGSYPVVITAANGIAPDASQNFTLNVVKVAYPVEPVGVANCAKLAATVNLKIRGMVAGRLYTTTMEVRDGSTTYMLRQSSSTFAGPNGTQVNLKWVVFPYNNVPALATPAYNPAWTTLAGSVTMKLTVVDRTNGLQSQSTMTYTCGTGVVSGVTTQVTPNVTTPPYAP